MCNFSHTGTREMTVDGPLHFFWNDASRLFPHHYIFAGGLGLYLYVASLTSPSLKGLLFFRVRTIAKWDSHAQRISSPPHLSSACSWHVLVAFFPTVVVKSTSQDTQTLHQHRTITKEEHQEKTPPPNCRQLIRLAPFFVDGDQRPTNPPWPPSAVSNSRCCRDDQFPPTVSTRRCW